jgi:Peptidase family M1 domain
MYIMKRVILIFSAFIVCHVQAQDPLLPKSTWQGKFEQLDQVLPTPNQYRTGSGAPGPNYWQQQADYEINVELNDDTHWITGNETITYTNNSPDVLKYLWLQLDQNILSPGNETDKTKTSSIRDSISIGQIQQDLDQYGNYTGGYTIKSVKNSGADLNYLINHTMMRVDLPQPLKSGAKFSFQVEWSYPVSDRLNEDEVGARGGMEFFPKDNNYLYCITHWFPRMCVYDDVNGWQNKQFLGQGEFTLPFGNYKVKITVPADHIIGATGVLQNPTAVLTTTEQERFKKATTTFDKPVIIVNQSEVVLKEKSRSKEKKTWEFNAENVRDFAFTSSRKFIWDAMAVKIGNNTSMAMSYYPKEGNPLWEQESTKAIKNTLITYSKYSLDYPYPVAISVHTANIGMEYPMICFNRGRPNADGTYSKEKRWGMIGVIIHEVGHNFFPMIINTDERQWTWMDEGLNSFVEDLTRTEHYPDMPKRGGGAANIVPYMKGDKSAMRPLMTNSEQVIKFGAEQYAKCDVGLNILRETIMGKELFDKAFKEYAQRWAFKHPKPADFFRTMEDASAVDLDWFWRGWFYTTDHCDVTLDEVKWFKVRKTTTDIEKKNKKISDGDLSSSRKNIPAKDFSQGPQPFSIMPASDWLYGEFTNRLDDKSMIATLENKNFYEVKLSNKGGLVMPVIIEWTYKDGTKETERLPAEIWRTNESTFSKVFIKNKEVANVVIDPLKETSDINTNDNTFPRQEKASKFDEMKKRN